MNKAGDVVLHVPENHETSILARNRAGWLRCRLLVPEEGQPTYTAVAADPVAVGVHHRRHRPDGARPGDPERGHRGVRRHPGAAVPVAAQSGRALGGAGRAAGDRRRPGATDWTAGRALRRIRTDDTCFHIDAFAGEVQFGPAVRQGDGTLRQYGAVPPKGAHLRLAVYRTGGGVQRQRRDRAGPGAQDQRAVRRPGGEPHAGGRRGARRGHRGRQAARAAGAALPRKGRHRRGFRRADQAGRAGDRPGALRRAPTAAACGCWWCRTSPATRSGGSAGRT